MKMTPIGNTETCPPDLLVPPDLLGPPDLQAPLRPAGSPGTAGSARTATPQLTDLLQHSSIYKNDWGMK